MEALAEAADLQAAATLSPTVDIASIEVELIEAGAAALLAQAQGLAQDGNLDESIAKFQLASAVDTSLDVDAEAEATSLRIEALENEANNRAQNGQFDQALAVLQEITGLDSSFAVEARKAELTTVAVGAFIRQAEIAAQGADIGGATLKFEEALALDPAIETDLDQLLKEFAAPAIVEQGQRLAEMGAIISATLKFEEALALDPDLAFKPQEEVERLAPRPMTLGMPVTSTTAIRTRWLFHGNRGAGRNHISG